MEFPKEMYDMFERIREQQDANLRMCTTLVAGFIATDERDVNYMDSFMDSLFDCMEQQNEEELLMRKYIDHIATFDAQEAKERTEHLEDLLGYKSHVACAACYLAEVLHAGQVDKGGKDYFISHLLSVGKSGHDWKEETIGFLHDAAEDTPHTVEEVIDLLKKKLDELLTKSNDDWKYKFEDYIHVYPGDMFHRLTEEEWEEIANALHCLNHHSVPTREEYIKRISKNPLARKVKMNDLESNMDISRIPNPTEKDFERLERYKKEYNFLLNFYRNQ